MHILYSFPHRLGVSGIGTTALQQVLSVARLGLRVTVVCGSCEVEMPAGIEVVETMKLFGIPIPYRLIGHRHAYSRHDRIVSALLRSRRQSFSAVHVWPGAARITLRTANQVGVPSFLERPNTHTAFAFDEVEKEHKLVGVDLPNANTHHRDLNRLAIEEEEFSVAHRILCPSDFVLRTFIERGFKPAQMIRHRYGCDLQTFPPAAEKHEDRPGLSACFVGRCEPRKGLHYALTAWHDSGAASAGGKFVICGTFMPGYREVLGRALDHASVQCIGFTTTVAEVMQKSDVFVLPAVEEGSALVTYEARASGCVLLVSDACGADVSHEVDGLVHPVRDIHCLTRHMGTLVSSRCRLGDLRQRSLAYREQMSWDHAGRILVAAYAAC